MGQAKDRRNRIERGLPVSYRDTTTGKIHWGRASPTVSQMRDMLNTRAAAEIRGERPSATVPCDGCTACCRMKKLDFNPADERPDSLAHLDYEPDPERPGWALLRRVNGACVHLGPVGDRIGCTVYPHRPRPCRLFDCRFFALSGIVEIYEDGSRWPTWVPENRDINDMLQHGGLQAAAQALVAQATAAGEPIEPQKIALGAHQMLPEIMLVVLRIHAALAKLPPAMQRARTAEANDYLRAEAQALARAIES
jgi:Fe-S-cluster containining protein